MLFIRELLKLDQAHWRVPSLVMNEMNSLTHSCMHSFASFAIFAFSGRAVFMMRATGAKLRMLASEAKPSDLLLDELRGGDEDDGGDADDMIQAACRPACGRGSLEER